MRQFVFNSRAQAQVELDKINAELGYPIVGVNAWSGQPAPDKQQTTSWDTPKEDDDGKFRFAELPDKALVGLSKAAKARLNGLTKADRVVDSSVLTPTTRP